MKIPENIRIWAVGAMKSLTVWTAVALAAAPDVLAQLQANFASVAPFLPQVVQPRLLQLIALLILLLRIRTTASLAAKGAPK